MCVFGSPDYAGSQTLTEQDLGSIAITGPIGGAAIVSARGNNIAVRERVGARERYVTLQGPGAEFDRILTGAVWIQDRLVYYAVVAGKYYLIDGKKQIPLSGTPTSPLISGRVWPSLDQTHYLSFISDGKYISWYSDGIKQATQFDKLNNVPNDAPSSSTPIFVATVNCVAKVIGHNPSAKANWDSVYWISSSLDGTIMYAYGENVGRMLLVRNGITIFSDPLRNFLASRDGTKWIAVVDRSTEITPRVVLMEDGKPAAEAAVDWTRQDLFLAANGSTWVWRIYDEDYVGVTLRQSGKPDRRLARNPVEYYLSEDGKREAYITVLSKAPDKVEIVVDTKQVSVEPNVTPRTFKFGPGSSFAFEVRVGELTSIISHLGRGPNFTEVSRVLFLPNGIPVYVARNETKKFIVVGSTPIAISADTLHDLTFRIEGTTAKVLGLRDMSLIAFSIDN